MTLAQQLKQAQEKNAQLAAQLELREQLHLALVKDLALEQDDLERHCAQLKALIAKQKAEREILERDHERLKAEFAEKTTLMREEIAFLRLRSTVVPRKSAPSSAPTK
jgi:cell division protein FtsB